MDKMDKRIPYTYLIGWSKYNKYYYGVRFGKNCNPDDLWKTYFTSSKHVDKFIKIYGNPDIIEIRKTFTSILKARLWETKVLTRLDAANRDIFLNKSNNICLYSESKERIIKATNTKYLKSLLGLYEESYRIGAIKQKETKRLRAQEGLYVDSIERMKETKRLRAQEGLYVDSYKRSVETRKKHLEDGTLKESEETRKKKIKETRLERIKSGELSDAYLKAAETRRTNNKLGINDESNRKRIEKLKETVKNRPKRICPHCGIIGGGGNMTRSHFDNCKMRPSQDLFI